MNLITERNGTFQHMITHYLPDRDTVIQRNGTFQHMIDHYLPLRSRRRNVACFYRMHPRSLFLSFLLQIDWISKLQTRVSRLFRPNKLICFIIHYPIYQWPSAVSWYTWECLRNYWTWSILNLTSCKRHSSWQFIEIMDLFDELVDNFKLNNNALNGRFL